MLPSARVTTWLLAMLCLGEQVWGDPEDIARFNALPAAARQLIVEHAERRKARIPRQDMTCIWFDNEAKKCRFYEHRPNICRELEVGSEGCRTWRQMYNVLAN